jgi:hypothetical protein
MLNFYAWKGAYTFFTGQKERDRERERETEKGEREM